MQDVANILNHRARLHSNIEVRLAQRIDFRPCDGIVGATRTGPRYKQKISRSLHMRILPAGSGLAFDNFAVGSRHLLPAAFLGGLTVPIEKASQPDADVVQLGIKIQRMHSTFASNAGKARSTKGGTQIAQNPEIHPCDADMTLLRDAMSGFQCV